MDAKRLRRSISGGNAHTVLVVARGKCFRPLTCKDKQPTTWAVSTVSPGGVFHTSRGRPRTLSRGAESSEDRVEGA